MESLKTNEKLVGVKEYVVKVVFEEMKNDEDPTVKC